MASTLGGAWLVLVLGLACASGAWGAAPGTPLGDPKPGPSKIQIDAALRNLSLAACPNKSVELLSVMAPRVTVLYPGAHPLLLNTTAEQEEFFSASFLPCGVSFTISDIAVGSGAPVPKPAPSPTPPTGGEVGGGTKTKPLAATRLIYVSYGELDVGKGLALWEGEKATSAAAGTTGDDAFTWKLIVIGWSSDLPGADSMALRRHRPQVESSAAGVTEAPIVDASSSASLADVTTAGEGALSFSRRDLLGTKGIAQGLKSGDDAALLWPLLEASFRYFAENCSAYDLANASLLFSQAVPYVEGEPGRPPVVAATEQERMDYTEQILGLNWTLEFQSVWSMKLNADRMGLGSRGGDSAFTITKMTGLWENGTYAFYAHNLMLWDAFPPPPQATGNLKGDSKASQMVLRWDLDNPLPLPAPAHAPAPASAPTPEEASPAPQEASSSSTFHKPKK